MLAIKTSISIVTSKEFETVCLPQPSPCSDGHSQMFAVWKSGVMKPSPQLSKIKAGKRKMHMCHRGLGCENLMKAHQCVTAGLHTIPER